MSKAITMVSRRGGTGKTEVVSAVLKAAEGEIKRGCSGARRLSSSGDPNNSLVSETHRVGGREQEDEKAVPCGRQDHMHQEQRHSHLC